MDFFSNACSQADVARAIARSRRDFLRMATGATLGTTLFSLGSPALLRAGPRSPKAVVVTFGGGSRDDETFAEDGQQNIPHLLTELIPRATFFTRVVNRGILGHYVATASLATGVYETFNNFAAVPPDYPTIFEYFRQDLKRPVTDAWVVAPSNGFNRIGESGHSAYGKGTGAGVILPKRLLSTALAGSNADFEHLLRDNYESPLATPPEGGNGIDLHALAEMLMFSVNDFQAHARTLSSPDELSVYIAKQLMRKLSPSLLWITLHDIDVAHSGAFSLYVDAIRRSDYLCAEIWRTIEADPEYAGNTTLFILPDFGRDSDLSPGGNGFQHHRTGDAVSRTTWMLVMGPGIRENVIVDRPVGSIDLVPTLGARFGFHPRFAKGSVLREVV